MLTNLSLNIFVRFFFFFVFATIAPKLQLQTCTTTNLKGIIGEKINDVVHQTVRKKVLKEIEGNWIQAIEFEKEKK